MKVLTLFMFMAGLWSSTALAAGFKSGDEFTHHDLRGQVILNCRGNNPGTRLINCSGYTISPVSHDYFVTNEKVNADKVELRVEHPNGKVRTKSSKFSANKQSSKKAFNLWLVSVFQRPLLHFGENEVFYSMKSKKKSVEEGKFKVRVNDGGTRQCRTRYMYTYNDDDCWYGTGNTCSKYFRFENNCRY